MNRWCYSQHQHHQTEVGGVGVHVSVPVCASVGSL